MLAIFVYVCAIQIKIKFFWTMIPSYYSADAKILQIDVTIMFGIRILATFPAYFVVTGGSLRIRVLTF